MATVETNAVGSIPDERTKPPFLRRVRIRGYKSIAFCDVELQPLTVLVGRNASGKSNFIDALVFLRDIVKYGLNEAVMRHGGVEGICCHSCNDRTTFIQVECEHAFSGDLDHWNAVYMIEIGFPKKRPATIHREELRIEVVPILRTTGGRTIAIVPAARTREASTLPFAFPRCLVGVGRERPAP